MEWLEEFDLYMRPVVRGLGRCRLKGGSTTTTERNIPDQTSEEKALQDYLMNYASGAGEISKYFLGSGTLGNAAGNVYSPEWGGLYNDVTGSNQSQIDRYKNRTDWANDEYGGLTRGALAEFKNNTGLNLKEYNDIMARNLGTYNDAMTQIVNQYNNATSQNLAEYNRLKSGQQSKWEDLTNGVLPSEYAANRQAALRDDVNKLYGGTINNAASRGIINSAVTNRALDDAEQNLSDTLAKMYTSDLGTQASLLGQQGQNWQDWYNTNATTWNDLYNNNTKTWNDLISTNMNARQNMYNTNHSTQKDILDSSRNSYNDMYDRYTESQNNMIDRQLTANDQKLQNAALAQTGSFEPISNYINYASTLSSPASNLYNTMYSGRMGTGSTTTSQKTDNSSGIWSAAGALGSAAIIACFTGDTLITTPTGYKCIRDIHEGDTVLSWKDGTVVEKQVSLVMEPREADIVEVYFDNGTVWHTTDSQRYFDGRHFCYVTEAGKPAIVHNGKPAEIVRVVKPGRREKVYDFTLYGFAGENVYFANDVAAEGLGD